MTYDEAVSYVMREKGAAYAFIPKAQAGRVVGSEIYAIAYDEYHGEDPDGYFEYNVFYSGGLFRSSSGEGDIFGPDDVPEEAKALAYLPTTLSAVSDYESMLELFLLRLKGMSDEEARGRFDQMTAEEILKYGG